MSDRCLSDAEIQGLFGGTTNEKQENNDMAGEILSVDEVERLLSMMDEYRSPRLNLNSSLRRIKKNVS